MESNVTVIELAAALIRVFEGLRLISYQDASPKKNWTIGFGHTGPVNGAPLAADVVITQEQAEQLLYLDCAPLLNVIGERPLLEAAALLSFGYNCGIGALEKVVSGHAHPEDFTHAGGVELTGLVSRRKLETALMLVSQQVSKH